MTHSMHLFRRFGAGSLIAALFATLVAILPIAARADTVPYGAVLDGTMANAVSTASAQPGQTVVLNNVTSQDGSIVGAKLVGHVADVQKAGQGKRPQIRIEFDRIRFYDGTSAPISGHVVSMEQKQQGMNQTVKEAGGAVVGNIVGNYLGKHLGTNLGGLLGAAGGYLYARNNHDNVNIPAGSTVAVQINRPVQRRQAG